MKYKGDILVVDDDIASLRLLSCLLAEYGYEVRSARDGSTALMMVAADPPDMVLLDVQMPEMDGYQVCDHLKLNPASRDIPVLFISARDGVFDKTRGFEVGGVDYVSKPYEEQELLARIETHMTISNLQAALLKRLNQLSALHNISKTITTIKELPRALKDVCKTIADLFEARLAIIALEVQEPTSLKGLIGHERTRGTISLSSAESKHLDLSLFRSMLSEGNSDIITSRQPIALPESIREYFRVHHVQSALVIPLISGRIGLGTLILAKDEIDSSFDKSEIELAETIATDIAAAIENERLTEQTQLAAVDAERQRLARELHDSVTQSVYSLVLLSSGWESMAREGTLDDPAGSFQRLGEVGQQALREMRLLLHQMRPSTLDKGIVDAIQQRLDAVERRANIDAQLVVQGNLTALPEIVEDELFKIVQEALNNALKHSRADSIKVHIEQDQGKIKLRVEDNGVGFDTAAKYSSMGLRNMLERANAIGGNLAICSEAEQGTQVMISLRLHQEA